MQKQRFPTIMMIVQFLLAGLIANGCKSKSSQDISPKISRADSSRLFTSKYISDDSLYYMQKKILKLKSRYESMKDFESRLTKTIASAYDKPMSIEASATEINYNAELEEFSFSIRADKIRIGDDSRAKEITRIQALRLSDWDSILNNSNGEMLMVYGFAQFNNDALLSEDAIKIKCKKNEAQEKEKNLHFILIVKISPEFKPVPSELKSDSLNDYAIRRNEITPNGKFDVIENVTFGAKILGYYIFDSSNGEISRKKLFSL